MVASSPLKNFVVDDNKTEDHLKSSFQEFESFQKGSATKEETTVNANHTLGSNDHENVTVQKVEQMDYKEDINFKLNEIVDKLGVVVQTLNLLEKRVTAVEDVALSWNK